MSNKTKKLLILNLPYFIAGLVCTNLGEAWRIAEGADMSEKLLGFLSALGAAFSNPMPSLHPMDLLIGVCFGAGLRLAVYLKGKMPRNIAMAWSMALLVGVRRKTSNRLKIQCLQTM